MLQNLFLLIFFFLPINLLFSQNLVPNPSFEKVTKITNRWIHNDQTFEERMEEWTTPNLGSPDIFFEKVLHKMMPPRRGVDLSSHRPRTGSMMVAIKTYGCATLTQHCKEYLQIELKKPIEKGEQYFIELWVNPMQTSIYTNNIGVVFSNVEIKESSEYGLHYFDPVLTEKTIVRNAPNDWYRISATVTADDDYNYLLIGNFFTDDETEIERADDDISYGYYLIDDVLVRPLKVNEADELNIEDFEIGNNLRLNNILFETAEATLLPASFKELNQLTKILSENPAMTIQINGHTDNQGTPEYNLGLSEKRAAAVLDYLSSKGIAEDRMQSKGFGESQPVTDNETAESQSLNRRVEVIVLTK